MICELNNTKHNAKLIILLKNKNHCQTIYIIDSIIKVTIGMNETKFDSKRRETTEAIKNEDEDNHHNKEEQKSVEVC